MFRIRIRVDLARLDPDPGARKLTKINKQTRFPAFQKSFCTYGT
jgi:hypothetical protein